MYCPQCKAEYRPGFTRCSDCEVDLVEVLPSEPHSLDGLTRNQALAEGTPDWGEMRTVWEGDNDTECADTCRVLLKEGVRYGVKQRVASRKPGMRVDWKYQIQVPAADYQPARKGLGYEEGDTELPEDAAPDPEIELPARDDLPVEDVQGGLESARLVSRGRNVGSVEWESQPVGFPLRNVAEGKPDQLSCGNRKR